MAAVQIFFDFLKQKARLRVHQRNHARQYLNARGDALAASTSTPVGTRWRAGYQHDPVVQRACYSAGASPARRPKAEDSDTF